MSKNSTVSLKKLDTILSLFKTGHLWNLKAAVGMNWSMINKHLSKEQFSNNDLTMHSNKSCDFHRTYIEIYLIILFRFRRDNNHFQHTEFINSHLLFCSYIMYFDRALPYFCYFIMSLVFDKGGVAGKAGCRFTWVYLLNMSDNFSFLSSTQYRSTHAIQLTMYLQSTTQHRFVALSGNLYIYRWVDLLVPSISDFA